MASSSFNLGGKSKAIKKIINYESGNDYKNPTTVKVDFSDCNGYGLFDVQNFVVETTQIFCQTDDYNWVKPLDSITKSYNKSTGILSVTYTITVHKYTIIKANVFYLSGGIK